MKLVFKIFLFLMFFASLTAFSKEVKFIHITDINLNTKNAYLLQKTIEEINQYSDIDFVVFGGNNISKANIDNLNTFLYLLKKVNKRCYVLLGSNDVFASNGIDKNYYLKRVKRALFFRHSSKPNYVFKKNGYVFVVMDGSKEYFQSTNGYYTKAELDWLDKTLSEYKDEKVIILQHFPITLTKSQWLQTAKLENYIEVLMKHNNVKMIVSGHYGDNDEKKIRGIYNIITESYSNNCAYKIIDMDLDDDYVATFLVK